MGRRPPRVILDMVVPNDTTIYVNLNQLAPAAGVIRTSVSEDKDTSR